ncbi:MAG: terminase small subunit [Alphaproteobacteria bacterium]|nr:terminase small subunit [Alphaproteobacteria bacterium]
MPEKKLPRINRVGSATGANPDAETAYGRLGDKQRLFVEEYLIDLNARAAAIRSGYAPNSSGHIFQQCREAIEERRAELDRERQDQHSGARFVLGKLWDVATADPRELVEIRRVPCRYCHGTNGQYQFTKTEMDRLLKAYEYGLSDRPLEALWPRGGAEQAAYTAGRNQIPFDPQGGDDYTSDREPNPDCAECGGRGIVLHFVADTRRLSHQARQLYRGVKYDPRGKYEVVMANQDAAATMLARHYNVGVERKELLVRTLDPNELSDEELHQAIAELEALTLGKTEYAVIKSERARQERGDNLQKDPPRRRLVRPK